MKIVPLQLKRHCLLAYINDLDISQRNCKKEKLERAGILVQGQMKALTYLERALGRPLRLMSHLFSGDGDKTKRRVYISGVLPIFAEYKKKENVYFPDTSFAKYSKSLL